MIAAKSVNSYPIIGYVFTEVQSGGQECGIILVDRGIDHPEDHRYVTAWYRDGDRTWSHGHYFTDLVAATWDMMLRSVGAPPEKRPYGYGGTP